MFKPMKWVSKGVTILERGVRDHKKIQVNTTAISIKPKKYHSPYFCSTYIMLRILFFFLFVCIPSFFTLMYNEMDTKEEHIQELRRLKDLSTVPSVQKVLENLINENRKMREPIKRSKVHFIHWEKVPMKMLNNVYTQQAQIQTIYITTGYAWSQTSSYIRYVSSKTAS